MKWLIAEKELSHPSKEKRQPETVGLCQQPPSLHHQAHTVGLSLGGVGNPSWKQEHLKMATKQSFSYFIVIYFIVFKGVLVRIRHQMPLLLNKMTS